MHFGGCKRAMKICDNMFDRVDKGLLFKIYYADRIMLLAAQLIQEDFEKACIAFWTIWNDRNSLCKEKPTRDRVMV